MINRIEEIKNYRKLVFQANKELIKKEHFKNLEWQNGYGIVSFGTKDLKWVVRYVLNQKEHHKTGKVFKRLESVEKEDG